MHWAINPCCEPPEIDKSPGAHGGLEAGRCGQQGTPYCVHDSFVEVG